MNFVRSDPYPDFLEVRIRIRINPTRVRTPAELYSHLSANMDPLIPALILSLIYISGRYKQKTSRFHYSLLTTKLLMLDSLLEESYNVV